MWRPKGARFFDNPQLSAWVGGPEWAQGRSFSWPATYGSPVRDCREAGWFGLARFEAGRRRNGLLPDNSSQIVLLSLHATYRTIRRDVADILVAT